MIRTICVLRPDQKADGTPCLKGELTKALTTTDQEGRERQFPRGTRLVLSKNAGGASYSLLALIDEVPPEEQAANFQAEIDAAAEDYQCPF